MNQIHRNMSSILLFLLWTVLLSLSNHTASNASGVDHPWCYKEERCAPSHWSGICKSGHSQSPIDINPSGGVVFAKNFRKIRLNEDYLLLHPSFYVKNNGHTVQVQLAENMSSTLHVGGDGFRSGSYQFSQMHFHWGGSNEVGSEHTVQGKSFPMELHLVHYSDKYANLLAALSDQNTRALAVLGIFFEISDIDNPNLSPIIESLQKVETYHPDLEEIKNTEGLNISSLFPENLEGFRYEGSLTTPSCGEKVLWTVFRNPVPISQKQLESFRKLKDQSGNPLVDNYRPTQPLTRRRVLHGMFHLSELKSEDIHTNVEQTTGHEPQSPMRTDDHSSKENEVDHDHSNSSSKEKMDSHDKKSDAPSIAPLTLMSIGFSMLSVGRILFLQP